jgi:hypothetical protein
VPFQSCDAFPRHLAPVHVRAGKDRLLLLMHADYGLQIDRTLHQYSGASYIQVREIRRAPLCHSEGCLALECVLAYSLLGSTVVLAAAYSYETSGQ